MRVLFEGGPLFRIDGNTMSTSNQGFTVDVKNKILTFQGLTRSFFFICMTAVAYADPDNFPEF